MLSPQESTNIPDYIYGFDNSTVVFPSASKIEENVTPEGGNQQLDVTQQTWYNYHMQMYQQIPYHQYGMYWIPPQPAEVYYPENQQIPTVPNRAKRAHVPRAPYSPHQIQVLMSWYKKSTSIGIEDRRRLSKEIQLTPNQIKVWFQNRRFKEKREREKIEMMEKLNKNNKGEIPEQTTVDLETKCVSEKNSKLQIEEENCQNLTSYGFNNASSIANIPEYKYLDGSLMYPYV